MFLKKVDEFRGILPTGQISTQHLQYLLITVIYKVLVNASFNRVFVGDAAGHQQKMECGTRLVKVCGFSLQTGSWCCP